MSNFVENNSLQRISTSWNQHENADTSKLPQDIASLAAQEELRSKESAAAIKIQSFIRGYLARTAFKNEKRHLLSHSLFEKAKAIIDEPTKLDACYRAQQNVFLPENLPIVLKQTGSPVNETRFNQMKQARELCEKSGYSHLVIPTARVHGDFIIESRLPIMHEHGIKEQIGFYIEHLEQFTKAVEEFTGFLCQSGIHDITGNTNDPYSMLSKVPIGRYDNVPMYLENGVGKLGLVDLEGFCPPSRYYPSETNALWACLDAIRLFPHHLETIMRAAEKFDPRIENHRQQIVEERDLTLEYFYNAYQKHVDFVKKNNIDKSNPNKLVEISENRKQKIKEVIEAVLRQQINKFHFKNCLGADPDATIKLFSEVAFPELLNATLAFIKALVDSTITAMGGISAISSYSELVSARTLEDYEQSVPFLNLHKAVLSKLYMLNLKERFKSQLTSQLIDALLKELENGGELAYYNPKLGRGGYACSYIFC